ncbi:hypothetical protein [Erythrobacter sp. R86502]|uniref:hypothetical protein n=1 Tax=Erythrobacter sp. R86502 TaxID=3093846 RepID=UPI0036D25B4A
MCGHKPDIVLTRYRAVVFVHGSFWHRHECDLFRWTESRSEFWRDKGATFMWTRTGALIRGARVLADGGQPRTTSAML